MPSTRQSARNKGPRTVYTEDPFAVAGISDDSSGEKVAPASKKKGKGRRRKLDESASDDEYIAGSDGGLNNEDEESASEEDLDSEDDENAEGKGEVEDEDVMEIDEPRATPRKRVKPPQQNLKKRKPDGTIMATQDETHYRGMFDPKEHVSKFMHYILTFGSDEHDLNAVIHTRGRWRWGRDSAFPTRASLNQAEGESDLPFGSTWGAHPDDVEKEKSVAWGWYYDGDIGSRFQKKQRIDRSYKRADVQRLYLPCPKEKPHTILMGPVDSQQAFQLGYLESMDISAAWGTMKGRKSERKTETKLRQGWLIGIGAKTQCIAWAPNQNGLSQYLAVVSPVSDEQKKKYNPPGSDPVSSFQPTLPYPSALQLWEFRGKEDGPFTNSVDMEFKPRLRLTLCFEWGDLRRISWCPMDRDKRDEDEQGDFKPLGLLAGVWGDGKVRVLDIKLSKNPRTEEYVKVYSPVFEAKPPSAVSTCVSWLSPSDIAVGCSNGFVGIWSILPSSTSEPQPYLYHPIHSTYVLNITSAYPSQPHLVSTISMDGETRLWSIIDPQSENTATVRNRLASPHLSYSPVLQAFCSNDDNDYGRLMPIRRFFATNTTGKIPSSVSALAPCSRWHPSIMYGGTGGEVVATNPLRRLLHSKEQHWQQLWFTHDWVPGSETESPGVSRFYEGYRAETQNLAKNMTSENRPMGLSLTTIYDEGTHVTALGWNPNRRCAGWGCAALGCGLLRVEDLAI